MDKDQEEIERMFAEADSDKDGCIDYTEFAGLWKAHVVDVQYTPMVKKMERIRLLLQAASSHTSTLKRPNGVEGKDNIEVTPVGAVTTVPTDLANGFKKLRTAEGHADGQDSAFDEEVPTPVGGPNLREGKRRRVGTRTA